MGRIANIQPKLIINQSLQRFPEKADEILLAKQLWEQQMEQRASRINNLQTQGNPLTLQSVQYPNIQLEPGVWYHRKWMANKLDPSTLDNGLPGGGYVDFIGSAKVPMGDWDFPDAIHHESSVSIKNVGDVYDSLQKYTTDNPSSVWQTYLTPGGVRAFELGQQMTPREFASGMYPQSPDNRFIQLNIDENYGRLAVDQKAPGQILRRPALPGEPNVNGFVTLQNINPDDFGNNINYPTQAFNARISGKPGREGKDFVAYPLNIVGQGMQSPYNRRIVREYHDIPILRSMAQDGMQPGVLPMSGLELLNAHLDSIPTQYRNQIERKLESLRY